MLTKYENHCSGFFKSSLLKSKVSSLGNIIIFHCSVHRRKRMAYYTASLTLSRYWVWVDIKNVLKNGLCSKYFEWFQKASQAPLRDSSINNLRRKMLHDH